MSLPGGTGTSRRRRRVLRSTRLSASWASPGCIWPCCGCSPSRARCSQVLEDSPEFFVARGNTAADIVLLACGMAFVPPSLLVLGEALLFRWRPARRVLHLVFVGRPSRRDRAAGARRARRRAGVAPDRRLAGDRRVGAWAYARTRLASGDAHGAVTGAGSASSPISSSCRPCPISFCRRTSWRPARVRAEARRRWCSWSSTSSRARRWRTASGRVDASALPQFRRICGRLHLVPERHHGFRPDDRGGAGASGGAAARQGAAAHRLGLSGQPLHDARGQPFAQRRRAGHRPLPASGCALRTRLPLRSRLRSLADDLSVVSAYLLLPDDLEDGLPAVDRTFGRFRQGGRDVAGGGIDAGVAAPRSRTARVSSRSTCAGSMETHPSRSSTSCTSPFPTFPGSTCLRASRTTSAERTHRACRTSTGRLTSGCPAGLPALPAAAGLRGQVAGPARAAAACRGSLRPFADRRDGRPRHQLPRRREPARGRSRQRPRHRQRPAVRQGAGTRSRAEWTRARRERSTSCRPSLTRRAYGSAESVDGRPLRRRRVRRRPGEAQLLRRRAGGALRSRTSCAGATPRWRGGCGSFGAGNGFDGVFASGAAAAACSGDAWPAVPGGPAELPGRAGLSQRLRGLLTATRRRSHVRHGASVRRAEGERWWR